MDLKLRPEFKDKKLFIFDLDGTIYRGKELIKDADTTIRKLMKLNKKIIYLTNNATKTIDSFCLKLTNMNCPCTKDQVVSSGLITMKMLYEDFNVRSLYIVGTDELVEMAENIGIKTLNSAYKDKKEILYAPFLDKSITCDVVLCAMDIELTYAKIRTGMELVARGAEFYATNADRTFPESQQIWPGAGVTVAAMEAAVGRPPKIVFGKPDVYGIELIFRLMNENIEGEIYNKKDALVIGDRLETDIWQANNAGVESLFVETGINTIKDIPTTPNTPHSKKLIPSYTLPHIKDIFLN